MKHAGRGFTLIEVICVVAIMGVAAAMIVPTVGSSLDRWAVRSAAQQIVIGIRQARQTAITLGREVKMELYRDGKYKIREYDVSKPSLETVYLDDRLDSITSNFEDDLYNIEVIGFNADGRPKQGGTITLKEGAQQMEITVLPVTGRVRIK